MCIPYLAKDLIMAKPNNLKPLRVIRTSNKLSMASKLADTFSSTLQRSVAYC